MNNRFSNNDLDRFSQEMMRVFSQANKQQDATLSPYFMARVQSRIREMQDTSQLWVTGIIGTQRWLVAFSLIALIFLVSNVVLVKTQPSNLEGNYSESLVLAEQDGSDWDHLNDEATLGGEAHKK